MGIMYIKDYKINDTFLDKKRINSNFLDIYPYENTKGNRNVHIEFTQLTITTIVFTESDG